jgi:hypothetical protein
VLFPVIVFGFYGVLVPVLSSEQKAALIPVYTFFAAATFFAAWLTSVSTASPLCFEI